jgi:hypothetical protein
MGLFISTNSAPIIPMPKTDIDCLDITNHQIRKRGKEEAISVRTPSIVPIKLSSNDITDPL